MFVHLVWDHKPRGKADLIWMEFQSRTDRQTYQLQFQKKMQFWMALLKTSQLHPEVTLLIYHAYNWSWFCFPLYKVFKRKWTIEFPNSFILDLILTYSTYLGPRKIMSLFISLARLFFKSININLRDNKVLVDITHKQIFKHFFTYTCLTLEEVGNKVTQLY